MFVYAVKCVLSPKWILKKKKKRKNVIFKNHHVATRIAHSDSCTAPPFAAGDDRHLRTLRL